MTQQATPPSGRPPLPVDAARSGRDALGPPTHGSGTGGAVGLTPSQVSCPSSLDGTVGAQMTGNASGSGVQTPVPLEVTGVDGTTVNFTMTRSEALTPRP